MSLVTIIWSMVAAACLTLAVVNLLVWFRQRSAWGNLLFSSTAVAAAAMAFCELGMMLADTPGQFGTALRWFHVAAFVIIVSLIGFVLFNMRAGRPWLAWTVCSLRACSLLLNFLTGQNLNYREVTGLRHIRFLGESVVVGVGVSNPWMLVGQLSLLLFVVFVADATVTVWRRGDRRQVVVTGGSIVFFVLAGTVQSVLVLWQMVQWPYAPSMCFMGIVAMMAHEMSREALHATQLAGELRESEQQMALAAEAANLGVWVRDLVRDEIWASERWRVLFGFTPAERLDLQKFLQRLLPDDREIFQQAVAKATTENDRYDAEFRVLLPDGRMRWIISRGRVEFSRSGKPVRVRGVSADITARKQAEAESIQQRAEMAHLSRVTMLGELSGSMAHELNQPLTAILSNTQAAQRFLAHEDVDLDEVRDILKDIVEQDNRAGEVIRRLRLLLKKGEVQQKPLDLNDVVQEVLKLIRSDLVNHSVVGHAELANDLPPVKGDRVQLQQVLLNLVMNACDAMNGNAVADRQFTVRTELCADKNVRVSVSDCGAGLALDKLEQVFEPFYTTKPHGLGLGLSVCRTIISAHGGKLWVKNGETSGAVFYFTIPVLEEAAD